MMKRVMALVVALAMLLSASALAEESSKYTLSLIDPMLSYTDVDGATETLDLAGLELALSLLLADGGEAGVMAELYSGENKDYLTNLLVQLDSNGLAFKLDGMSSCYTTEEEAEEIRSLYYMLAMLNLRAAVNSMGEEALATEFTGLELNAETRIAIIESVFGPYVVGTKTAGDKTVHKFEVPREAGRNLIEGMEELLDEMDLDIDLDIEDDISFDLAGTLTAVGSPADGSASWSIDAAGNLYNDDLDVAVPVTLTYTDDMENVTAVMEITSASGETMRIVLDGGSMVMDDGRTASEMVLSAILEGEALVDVTFDVHPVDGDQVDYALVITDHESGEHIGLNWATGYGEAREGFLMEFSTNMEGEDVYVGFTYEGDVYEAANVGAYRAGEFSVTAILEGETVTFSTDVLLLKQDLPTGDWLFDSSAAIDVEDMTESETTMLGLGVLGVIGNVLPKLQQDVPALAPYIDMLMGEMMG